MCLVLLPRALITMATPPLGPKLPFVLVLRPGDLSEDKTLALRLASQIWATGVELLTVRGELPPRPVAIQDTNPLQSNDSDPA